MKVRESSSCGVADLHVHTSATDGRHDPTRVLEDAAARGLSTVVFTDHSVVTYSSDLVASAAGMGVDLAFPGMEVSTVHAGRRHHFLLYGHGVASPEMQAVTDRPLRMKNDRFRAALELVRAQGMETPPDDDILRGRQPDGRLEYPGKMMFSRTVAARTIGAFSGESPTLIRRRISEALAKVGESQSFAPEEMYASSDRVLAVARSNGILTGLAHPLWQCRDDRDAHMIVSDIERFRREHGMAGIEFASYHHRSPGRDPCLTAVASRLGLCRLGGSDYHANGKSALGNYALSHEEFERVRRRLEEQPVQEAKGRHVEGL